MIMLITGASAGPEDFTPALMEELGELFVHDITVMPGKPALIAVVGGRPVVGIPDYPEIAKAYKRIAFEETNHAARFAEMRKKKKMVALCLSRDL